MGWKITFIILGLVWLWIVYEIHMAPEVDEYGNIVHRKKKK